MGARREKGFSPPDSHPPPISHSSFFCTFVNALLLSLGLTSPHTLYFTLEGRGGKKTRRCLPPCLLATCILVNSVHSRAAVKYAWQHIFAHWWFFFFFSCQGHILCRLQYHPLTPIKKKKTTHTFSLSPSPLQPCWRTIEWKLLYQQSGRLLLLALRLKQRWG